MFIGIGLGVTRGSGSGYSSEAVAFFARLATQPSAARKTQYDTLIVALVAAGVWDKLDALYVLAAADSATALTSLISAAYNATAVNSPTFTADQGFTGANTKYLDTAFNPTTAPSPQFAQNSATMFVWSLTAGQDPGRMIGQKDLANTFVVTRFTDDLAYTRINNVVNNVSAASTDGSGFFLATRRGANDTKFFKSGSQIATNANASSALGNGNITIFVGDSPAAYSTSLCGFAGFGSKLTDGEGTALYNSAHTYMQAVAGVA